MTMAYPEDFEANREQRLAIARDLCIIPGQGDIVDSVQRAKMIREYIEWILDKDRNFISKQAVGFSTLGYQSNLLIVTEQTLPILVASYRGNHREFPLLGNVIERLRRKISSFES
ncbi:MAG: hypothetical protein PHQ95_01245 [Candidatus Gracilibacteria bacterium]|nr:hypothetical protein [Candidatus Gracilibacteria bacterium]